MTFSYFGVYISHILKKSRKTKTIQKRLVFFIVSDFLDWKPENYPATIKDKDCTNKAKINDSKNRITT